MSEHLRNSESTPRPSAEIEKAAAERLRQLEKSPEQRIDKQEQVQAAREQIRTAEQVRPQAEAAAAPEPTYGGVLTRAANYRHTMISLRHRMKPGARAFSKVIHAPVVEATSEVVGKTVLRPSVSLGATTTAVLLTGFVYLYARHYGFLLRGSEIWITLILGGVIGLVIEGIYKSTRRLARR